MQTYHKQLFLLKQGERFIHNDTIYTVHQHEGNMTEVSHDGKFSAWPSWNGKAPTIVMYIKDENQSTKPMIKQAA